MNMIGTIGDWLMYGERGVSSETIAAVVFPKLFIRAPCQFDPPADPDDFKRCRLLVEQVPAVAIRLHELRALGGPWPYIVLMWDEWCKMMDREAPEWRDGRGQAPRMYDAMKACGC